MAVETGDLLRIAVGVSWCFEWNTSQVSPCTVIAAQADQQHFLLGAKALCTDTWGCVFPDKGGQMKHLRPTLQGPRHNMDA